jgi:iron complex transport system substrate-binding protein
MQTRDGGRIIVPRAAERIISAAPSNTEIVVGLGLADKLIAVDVDSFDVAGLPAGLPFIDAFNPDGETLIKLNPDIIIASGLSGNALGNDSFRLLREMGIAVVYIPLSRNIDDICGDIAFIADILNVPSRGAEIIAGLRQETLEIAAIGRTITDKKTVYFEISPAPSMYSFGKDTFLDELLTLVGAVNIFADENRIIAPVAEVIIAQNPDIIITNIKPPGPSIDEILSRDGFENVTAVKTGRVYYIDANSSSRPTHNIVTALRQMAYCIYPEYYEQP